MFLAWAVLCGQGRLGSAQRAPLIYTTKGSGEEEDKE
jgi:hypothetical protein